MSANDVTFIWIDCIKSLLSIFTIDDLKWNWKWKWEKYRSEINSTTWAILLARCSVNIRVMRNSMFMYDLLSKTAIFVWYIIWRALQTVWKDHTPSFQYLVLAYIALMHSITFNASHILIYCNYLNYHIIGYSMPVHVLAQRIADICQVTRHHYDTSHHNI